MATNDDLRVHNGPPPPPPPFGNQRQPLVQPVENPDDFRPLREFAAPGENGRRLGYVAPKAADQDFELKPSLIHMVGQNQFGGMTNENPRQYLANFEETCGTFRQIGPQLDTLKLRVFHLSLKDKARGWLRTVNPGTIQTWDDLQREFLNKYFPPSKTQHLRTQIATFRQNKGESLTEAWDRFQDLLRLCLHHGLSKWLLAQIFYGGMTYSTKSNLDSAAGGCLLNGMPLMPLVLLKKWW